VIFHNDADSPHADVGISLETSPYTQVYHNTIFLNRYFNAIEYRFAETHSVSITDNLANRAIASRNGGSGTLFNNRIDAPADWFVDASRGDLHLTAKAISALDQGSGRRDLTTDFDGDDRSSQGPPDIGADEYRGPLTLVPSMQAGHSLVIQGIAARRTTRYQLQHKPTLTTVDWSNHGSALLAVTNEFSFIVDLTPEATGYYQVSESFAW
jgi:hypothetical protein